MYSIEHVGGSWLVENFGIGLVQPLAVESRIGPRRSTNHSGSMRQEVFQPNMRPESSLAGHLTFHLKHEVVHLELLARLFAIVDPSHLAEWVKDEPSGQYARRVGFLYEWITGWQLPIAPVVQGGYYDALDAGQMLVATTPINNQRWRIRDNLPGSPEFCPTVRLTEVSRPAAEFDVGAALKKQEAVFGAEVLRRSAVWMTLKESRSSFLIEGEQDQTKKVQRFAAVMETRTGQGSTPLSPSELATLQAAILGDDTTLTTYGLRKSPVFVGQNVRYENVVHYVAPAWELVPKLVEGLTHALSRTAGQIKMAAARAAIASFSFIYIHPLADGNGRLHRFLINDTLRRDGVVPAPFILPVSALITDSSKERADYDRALETFSRPLMQRYGEAVSFSDDVRAEADGIRSNFSFSAYDEAMPAWRFLDLTSHVTYLGHVLQFTIEQEMHEQAKFFRSNDLARRLVKDVIEGPDTDIDAIIHSARENGGALSGKLAKRFPVLEKLGRWNRVMEAINTAFAEDFENKSEGDEGKGASVKET
jgi:hypothetical protein